MGKFASDDWTQTATYNANDEGDMIVGILESKKNVKTTYGDQRVYRFTLDDGTPCDFWGAKALDNLMDAHWTDIKGKRVSVTFTGLAADGRTKLWEIDDFPAAKAKTHPAPRMPDVDDDSASKSGKGKGRKGAKSEGDDVPF